MYHSLKEDKYYQNSIKITKQKKDKYKLAEHFINFI
jgi:hypothetical protein